MDAPSRPKAPTLAKVCTFLAAAADPRRSLGQPLPAAKLTTAKDFFGKKAVPAAAAAADTPAPSSTADADGPDTSKKSKVPRGVAMLTSQARNAVQNMFSKASARPAKAPPVPTPTSAAAAVDPVEDADDFEEVC